MKTVNIAWQRLVVEGQTCPRCGSTEHEVDKATAVLSQSLKPRGIEVALEKIEISEGAFNADSLQSNMIRINDRLLEDWLGATSGQSQCCDVCGPNDCRTIGMGGEEYETIPSELIIKAGLLAASQLDTDEALNTEKYPKGEHKMKIEIYDPAMCCSTGVCGPSVDPELVRIQEALRQIQKQAPEVQVLRFGLSSAPQAFVANSVVAELLKSEGPECLPLAFVDGELVCKGRYPGDDQLRDFLKRDGIELTLGVQKKSSCGCGPGCC
jgi:Arsenical resistance operon protein ArsD/Domain of unknown function (DUF2703)